MDFISNYILHLADSALILGHRNSEWTGHGPILEQDIALSNIALDLIGQARNFYQLAAARLNESSPGKTITEDDLAYLRNENEFSNLLLVEQPNGDWAHTILRQFFFSYYQLMLYEDLINSSDRAIAAISEKSIKETRYHIKWSREWVLRLGDGTTESHQRMLNALQTLEPFLSEIFTGTDFELAAAVSGVGILPVHFKTAWFQQINNILDTATLPPIVVEINNNQILNGKKGMHSQHLKTLLGEMQILQRTYPGSNW